MDFYQNILQAEVRYKHRDGRCLFGWRYESGLCENLWHRDHHKLCEFTLVVVGHGHDRFIVVPGQNHLGGIVKREASALAT